jgi:hypothetical protein
MSGSGTFRTWRDVRLESVMRFKADIGRPSEFMGSGPKLETRDAFGSDVAEQLQQSRRTEFHAANTRPSPHLVQISAVLSTLFRSEFSAAGFFQCRQIGLHQLPQDRCGDTLVVVAQYVADSRNFLPRDFRIARFQLIRKRATKAFSSEVETGSRQENASNQESRAPLRFHRSG